MIRVAAEDGKGAVDLFAEDDAGELVGQSHGAEGEMLGGAAARGGGPAVSGADGEDEELAALVALAAEPLGQGCRGELTAALVEERQERSGTGALALDGVPESVFGAEEGSFQAGFAGAGQERRDAVEVETGEGVEGVAGTGADSSDPELHGTSVGPLQWFTQSLGKRMRGGWQGRPAPTSGR